MINFVFFLTVLAHDYLYNSYGDLSWYTKHTALSRLYPRFLDTVLLKNPSPFLFHVSLHREYCAPTCFGLGPHTNSAVKINFEECKHLLDLIDEKLLQHNVLSLCEFDQGMTLETLSPQQIKALQHHWDLLRSLIKNTPDSYFVSFFQETNHLDYDFYRITANLQGRTLNFYTQIITILKQKPGKRVAVSEPLYRKALDTIRSKVGENLQEVSSLVHVMLNKEKSIRLNKIVGNFLRDIVYDHKDNEVICKTVFDIAQQYHLHSILNYLKNYAKLTQSH